MGKGKPYDPELVLFDSPNGKHKHGRSRHWVALTRASTAAHPPQRSLLSFSMASIFTGAEQAASFGDEAGAMDGAGIDAGAMDGGLDGAADGGFSGGVDGGVDGGYGGNAGGNVRPGDWSCPSCGINNFASRLAELDKYDKPQHDNHPIGNQL